MKKLLILLFCLISLKSVSQTWYGTGTSNLQRTPTAKGWFYRNNMGSLGNVTWYTAPQLDSLLAIASTGWVPTTRLVSTTSPLQGGGNLASNLSLSILQSSTSQSGYLSNTDWNTFNNKEASIAAGTTLQYWRGDKTFQTLNTAAVPELTNLYYTDVRSRAALSFAAGSGAYNNTTGVIIIPTNNNQITNGAGYGTGTVTSITPGYGFTSSTPITTTGTMTIDTTKLLTVTGAANNTATLYRKTLQSTYTKIWDGTRGIKVGGSSLFGGGMIWDASVGTPGDTNFSLMTQSGSTTLNTTGNMYFGVLGTSYGELNTTGFSIDGVLEATSYPTGAAGTDRLLVQGTSGGNFGSPVKSIAANYYAPATGGTGYINNQNSTFQTAQFKLSGGGYLDSLAFEYNAGADNRLKFKLNSLNRLTLFDEVNNGVISKEIFSFRFGGGGLAPAGPHNDSPGWVTYDHNYTTFPGANYYFGGDNGVAFLGYNNDNTFGSFIARGRNVITYDTTGNVSFVRPNTTFTAYGRIKLNAAHATYSGLEFQPKQRADSLYAQLGANNTFTTNQIIPSINITGTGGNGYISLVKQSATTTPITGAFLYAPNAENQFAFNGANGFSAIFSTADQTAARTLSTPDASGTIALTATTAQIVGTPYAATGKTNVGSLISYSVPADGVYRLSYTVFVTQIATNTLRLRINFTTVSGQVQSATSGTVSTVTASTALAATSQPAVPVYLKGGTTIDILSENVVSGGSQTYDVVAFLEKIL